jgi:hypothetical protein
VKTKKQKILGGGKLVNKCYLVMASLTMTGAARRGERTEAPEHVRVLQGATLKIWLAPVQGRFITVRFFCDNFTIKVLDGGDLLRYLLPLELIFLRLCFAIAN